MTPRTWAYIRCRRGLYRIQVNSPSETLLIVRQGEAEVLTNQGSTKVEAGQIIQIHGTDNPEYKIDPAPGGDDFDKWCGDRDRQIQSAQAWQHTDPQYTGSSDLDTYGQWERGAGLRLVLDAPGGCRLGALQRRLLGL